MRHIARDSWIGLVMLAVAAVYWFEADKIRISPLDGPVNASGLPKSLAFALGFLAILLVLRGLLGTWVSMQATKAAEPNSSFAAAMRPHLRAVGMLGIGVGYLLIVSWLGYIFTIIALLAAVSLYNGAKSDYRLAAFAVGGGIFYHLFFVEFLGIPLPPGLLLGPLLG